MDGEDETWLTNWERDVTESLEEQPDYDAVLISDMDNSHRKMWSSFQDSATSVAQLYRERLSNQAGALWLPFQAAAGNVTALYKESCDSVRRTSETAKHCGYQRRNRELLNWAKKKRRQIPREDLLAYLSGKPLPPKPSNHYGHHHISSHHRASPRPRNLSPPPGVTPPESLGTDAELHTFRDALSRSPLSRRARGTDLCSFIAGEIARHCKRPASPSDVIMSSPTHQKKPRYM